MNKQQIIVLTSILTFLYIITTFYIHTLIKTAYILITWIIGILYLNEHIKTVRKTNGRLWIRKIPLWMPVAILLMPIIIPLALIIILLPGDPFNSKTTHKKHKEKGSKHL